MEQPNKSLRLLDECNGNVAELIWKAFAQKEKLVATEVNLHFALCECCRKCVSCFMGAYICYGRIPSLRAMNVGHKRRRTHPTLAGHLSPMDLQAIAGVIILLAPDVGK